MATLAEIIAEMEKDAKSSHGFPNSMSSRGEDSFEEGKAVVLDKYIAKLKQLEQPAEPKASDLLDTVQTIVSDAYHGDKSGV